MKHFKLTVLLVFLLIMMTTKTMTVHAMSNSRASFQVTDVARNKNTVQLILPNNLNPVIINSTGGSDKLPQTDVINLLMWPALLIVCISLMVLIVKNWQTLLPKRGS